MKDVLNYRNRRAKGFTLVELIVVISIVAVLSAILVPNIIGYVRKAKCTAAIADAKTIVTGAKTSLIEEMLYGSLNTDKDATIGGKKVKVGGITNTALNNALTNKTNTNSTDTAIAKSILKILENAGIDPGNAKSGGTSTKPFGKTGTEYVKSVNSNYGIVLLYTSDGDVPLMQIYHKGILVTYANGNYVANDDNNAKFLDVNSNWSTAFIEAGSSDIDTSLYSSKLTAWR